VKTILLADDSITIQKVVELTFSDGNYQVVCVSNGAQALKKIPDLRPDIVLLDVVMPEKSGYEVCEQIKSDPATASIPVILLTGTFEPFDRRRAEAAGASGHLTKPFESQALVSRVEELMAQASQPRTEPAAAAPQHPAFTPPSPSTGGSYHSFADLGLDDAVMDAVEERLDPASGPATMRMSREAFQPAPPPETSEEPLEQGSAGQGGFMDGFVPGYEIPEGVGRASAAPRGAPEETAAGEASSAPTHPAPDLAGDEASPVDLSQDSLDRLAEIVVRKLSDRVVREIAWEVIPSVAEAIVRQRIKELEEGR
jgi:CheY-like chemotaxis protein